MKITYHNNPDITLDDFAAKYGLSMNVRERTDWAERGLYRFYASFGRLEVKVGGGLLSEYGDGATPEEAITNYCELISNKHLVRDAYQETRIEFISPTILPIWTEEKND